MPQRFLRPGITTSDRWNAVSFEAQSLFVRILTLVDDFGRYDGRVPILHGQCFALRPDITPQRTAALRSELHESGLLDVYAVDGKDYVQIAKWQERARCDKSKYPEPGIPQESAAERSGPQEKDASLAITSSPLHPRHKPSVEAEASSPAADATTTPSTNSKGEKKKQPDFPESPAELTAVPGFTKSWMDFQHQRRATRKPLTAIAAARMLPKLAERPRDAVAVLEMAIENSWQGFEWAWFDNRRVTGSGQKSDGDGTASGASASSRHCGPATDPATDRWT